MKLHEVITKIDSDEYLSYENIHPYLNSIVAYFQAHFFCLPIFMATFVTNNSCVGKIVPESEFHEITLHEIAEITNKEERESEEEIISANSFYLHKMIEVKK
jgi:hypothetical protein